MSHPHTLAGLHTGLKKLLAFVSDATPLRVMSRDQWFGVLPAEWARIGGFKFKEFEDFRRSLDRGELLRLAVGACAERDGDLQFVAVVGEISSGKSSLINALLGRKLQRVAVTRSTVAIHMLSHTINGETLAPLCNGLFAHHPHLTPSVEQNLTDAVLKGMVIVDTPGFGEANALTQNNEWRDDFVREFLAVCDVILFVMHPRSPTALDMQIMPRWAEDLPAMPAVFATTHADLVPADELPEVAGIQRMAIRDAVAAKLLHLPPAATDAARRAVDGAAYVWVTVQDPKQPHGLDAVTRVLDRHRQSMTQPDGRRAKGEYFRRRCATLWDRVAQFVAARSDESGKSVAEVERRMASAKDVHRQLSMDRLHRHWADRRAETERLIQAATTALGKLGPPPAPDATTPLAGWATGMDQATDAAVSEIVAGIRTRADTGLRQLYHEAGRGAAASVRAANPADFTVRPVSDDEVTAAIGLTAHAPIDLWFTARLGAQADALPTACKSAVAGAAACGRQVADQLEQANAALTDGAAEKVIETARAFAWEKVRTEFTGFLEMFRTSIVVHSPQATEYHDWPHLAARWQEVNRTRTPAEWDAASAAVVGDLLPPARASQVLEAVAARRRRVQQTLADTRAKLDGHADHLTRFDALYAQEVSAVRAQAEADTRRLVNGLMPDHVKTLRERLARMRDEAQRQVREYLREVNVKFALQWGALVGLGVVGLLLGVFYLFSLIEQNGMSDLWKLVLSLVSAAAVWVFKEKVLNPYSRENYSPHGGYSEEVVEKCRAIIRESFTPTGDVGESIANNCTTHVKRQLTDQRQRLLKSAAYTEYQRAYVECLALHRTLAECHTQQAADLPKLQREFHGLLTFAADPTETLGVHMSRLVEDSVRLVKGIADDWAGIRQEFDALRRWSPHPDASP